MKRLFPLLLTIMLCCTAALAQTVPDEAIRAALLENDSLSAYPTCEVMAEWHQVLAEDEDGDSTIVYIVADTTAFGEVNGVFLGQHGKAMPAVMTFTGTGDDWQLTKLEPVSSSDDLEDYMPEEACEAFDEFDEDEADEAIRKEAKAWLKAAGRSLDVAVNLYEMEEDLDDVELPSEVWYLTVGWPVGYLDKLATCRYDRNGRTVSCTTAWEPDEDDDELGLLTYTMTDEASGETVEQISILVTENEAVITMEDAGGTRTYFCDREDDEITAFTTEADGECGIDVTVLEENLRIAMMDGIEAYN